MDDKNEYFNKALSNFVKDFACRDEILAKVRRGLSASEIYNELTFKIPIEDIERIIEYSKNEDDYIKVNGPLGKVSFIRNNKKQK